MNIEEIIKQLKYNSDPVERRRAAEILITNKSYSNDSLNALILGLLDFDNDVKNICVRGLLSMPKDLQHQAALSTSSFIKNKNIEVRHLAADILTHLGDRALDVLITFFSDEDPDNRKFACDIVAKINSKRSIPYIVSLLDDSNMNVVTSAIDALGDLKDSSSVLRLCDMYYKNDDLKPDIIETLGKIGGERSQKFLIKILHSEKDTFLKAISIDALSRSSVDISICEYLYNELPNVPQELQLIFLKTIYSIYFRLNIEFQIPDEHRYIAYLAIMDNEDENIRMAGLLALGKTYRDEDIKYLLTEITRNIFDTQQLIIYNLLFNTPILVIKKFLNEYFTSIADSKLGLDFFVYFPQILKQLNKQDGDLIINVIFEIILNTNYKETKKIIEILLNYDREIIILRLRDLLDRNNIQLIDDIIEIVTTQELHELLPDLEKMITNNMNLPDKTIEIIRGL